MNQETLIFTNKQQIDFTEFKHSFARATMEQQGVIPEYIRSILLNWRENLSEFISACIDEKINNRDISWFSEIPSEYNEIIYIEENRMSDHQTFVNLNYENKKLKKQIQDLKHKNKVAEDKLKFIVQHATIHAIDEHPIDIIEEKIEKFESQSQSHILPSPFGQFTFGTQPQNPIANPIANPNPNPITNSPFGQPFFGTSFANITRDSPNNNEISDSGIKPVSKYQFNFV